jgi:hypothetical protein
MLYLIEDYMTPELLHLYQELYKTGAYFYRNPKQPGMHLLVIDKATINFPYEFGVPELVEFIWDIELAANIAEDRVASAKGASYTIWRKTVLQ